MKDFQINSFFSKQSTFLKLLFILFGITISTLVNFKLFLIIFSLTLLYLIITPKIYLIWLKTLLKLIPFFISYFFFGIIFRIPFDLQGIVVTRIIFILLLSVYLVSTSSIETFLIDSTKLSRSKLLNDLRFFLVATIYFIPVFIDKFKIASFKKTNIIDIISASLNQSIKEIKSIEIRTMEKIKNAEIKQHTFEIFPNFYLIFIFLIYFSVLFIKY